jgi:hypothetical protein
MRHARRSRWLGTVALAMTVAATILTVRFDVPSAAEAPKPQTPAEADAALAALTTARRRPPAAPPAFTVTPRKETLAKYPCTNCHDNTLVDTRVRPLVEEHRDLVFDHGGGRFWCYDACHAGRNIDALVSLRGRPVDYDAAYAVCGQCHAQRERDWLFGGHGKRAGAWNTARDIPLTATELLVAERERIGTWRDGRVLLNCTACHDAHSPSIKPFQPSPAPGLRPGISRRPGTPHPEPKAWQRAPRSAH